MSVYEEYLEIFGNDEEKFGNVSHKIKEMMDKIDNQVCQHDWTIFPDGRGYCVNCATRFVGSSADSNIGGCKHQSTYEDRNGLHICQDCGSEIEIADFKPEWRYYGNSDSRSNKDPARCKKRSNQSNRGLKKLFEELKIDIPESILSRVENKYKKVTNGATMRGKTRKAIVAACLFFAYQEFGQYRTASYIRDKFDLKQKKMSAGLSRYYIAFPDAKTTTVSCENLVLWMCDTIGIDTKVHYQKIRAIAIYLKDKSVLFKRSNPRSATAAIIYFYLCLNPEYKAELELSKNKFAEKAQLSDITVAKLTREAEKICNCFVLI